VNHFLLVEDDELVGTMVSLNLRSEGHEVEWVTDGRDALKAVRLGAFDLILLDIGLPGLDGLEVLKELRRRGVGTPVLMLTARSEVDDKVSTLEIGADDYLTKPFEVSEMTARVRALVRRSQGQREVPADHVIRIGAAEVNLSTREGETAGGTMVALSEKEAAILEVLARAGGQPVSRAEILDQVWGLEEYPTERTVDNFLLRLRRLFEPEPEHPKYILTVRGAGYRLAV